jgi:hypothetical protein
MDCDGCSAQMDSDPSGAASLNARVFRTPIRTTAGRAGTEEKAPKVEKGDFGVYQCSGRYLVYQFFSWWLKVKRVSAG